MLDQADVVIAGVIGDLLSQPGWRVDVLVCCMQFNLGDDKAGILSFKNIYLPDMVVLLDKETRFFDQGTQTQVSEDSAGIIGRNRIFVFRARYAKRHAFYIQVGFVSGNTNPNGTFFAIGKIPLDNMLLPVDPVPPGIVFDQKFSFYFYRHECIVTRAVSLVKH